ncbi:hypothetical protein ACHAXS_007322 [Conticribra weissflogii]
MMATILRRRSLPSTRQTTSSPLLQRTRSRARPRPQSPSPWRHLSSSVYGFGTQWTGALSRGPEGLFLEEAPELSDEELRQLRHLHEQYPHYRDQDHHDDEEGEVDDPMAAAQKLVPLLGRGRGPSDENAVDIVAASAGWGHTALIARGNDAASKLMVCGRPHDFQTMLRLRRLPAYLRNFALRSTLAPESHDIPTDERVTTTRPRGILRSVASFFAGEDVTFHEEEHRRYSMIPTLTEIRLPDGEFPAVEGEPLNDAAFSSHGTLKHRENGGAETARFHTRFQNTLDTSAGLTAVVSNTGTLYTFGLNHRGQCGIGKFSPNVWFPTKVAGLASREYTLDYLDELDRGNQHALGKQHESLPGNREKDATPINFSREQEHPIISVSLGLQHGIALDSAGQVFCWGKGERGQLGLGRRLAHESLTPREKDEISLGDSTSYDEEKQPNENKTLEYAIHVPHFYDPYATISTDVLSSTMSSSAMHYAPLLSPNDSIVRLVSAGMNFSLAITNGNLPYIWGKNCVPNPDYQNFNHGDENGNSTTDLFRNLRNKPVVDSPYPRYVPGLPPDLQIVKVACGSHHAAMLLEDGSVWAVGVATDRPIPLWGEAVEILERGVIQSAEEVVSFTAGFDRTVIVAEDGSNGGNDDGGDCGSGRRQVVEMQLWSSEELRMHGAVRPLWVESLEGGWLRDGRKGRVKSVHRGWMHTIIVTDED